jgi:hypothetical protein
MSGSGLGWPEVGMTADVDQGFGNGDGAPQRVDPLGQSSPARSPRKAASNAVAL